MHGSSEPDLRNWKSQVTWERFASGWGKAAGRACRAGALVSLYA
ncbi:hypothetical protein [Bordetella pertussis]|nr:hypothetical protein [Bordetella pertussis]